MGLGVDRNRSSENQGYSFPCGPSVPCAGEPAMDVGVDPISVWGSKTRQEMCEALGSPTYLPSVTPGKRLSLCRSGQSTGAGGPSHGGFPGWGWKQWKAGGPPTGVLRERICPDILAQGSKSKSRELFVFQKMMRCGGKKKVSEGIDLQAVRWEESKVYWSWKCRKETKNFRKQK